MKIKLSQYTPRVAEQTITKVSLLTRKVILEDIVKICLESNAIHVTRKDTMLENVLETKVALTRRREARKDIMLTLQRMMNLPERKPKKKLKKNMFLFLPSQALLHMEAMISSLIVGLPNI